MVKLWVRILLKGKKRKMGYQKKRKKRPLPDWLQKKIESRKKWFLLVKKWGHKPKRLFSFFFLRRKKQNVYGLTLGKKSYYLLAYYLNPVIVSQLTSQTLVNAGLHLGGRWNHEMSSVLLGKRHSFSLIDLTSSLIFLRRGLVYVGRAVSFRLPILVLLSGNKSYLSQEKTFQGIGGKRYIPGTLSNYRAVKLITELPGIVCIGDSYKCVHAIKECGQLQLPFLGLCDSEMDPNWFCFPVFGNNDGAEGTQLLVFLVQETISLEWMKRKAFFSRFWKKKKRKKRLGRR